MKYLICSLLFYFQRLLFRKIIPIGLLDGKIVELILVALNPCPQT